jgi:hypothetical protein
MDARTKRQVQERAGNRCEYCGLHQIHSPLAALQIEHITPRKHRGDDSLENLALACIDCNLAKGPNLAGLDPDTGLLCGLFNPRHDVWAEHFEINGALIVGKSAIGRTAVAVLNMNSDDQVALRQLLTDDARPPTPPPPAADR